jgi:hypothetical protein
MLWIENRPISSSRVEQSLERLLCQKTCAKGSMSQHQYRDRDLTPSMRWQVHR